MLQSIDVVFALQPLAKAQAAPAFAGVVPLTAFPGTLRRDR
jgi:hypothetical protein